MPSPIEDPLSPVLWRVLGVMVVFLALVIICKIISTRGWLNSEINKFKNTVENTWNAITPHHLLLEVLAFLSVAAIFLGQVTSFIGDRFQLPALTSFGEECTGFSFLPLFGLLGTLALVMKGYEQERIRAGVQALLSRKNISMENNISINNSQLIDTRITQAQNWTTLRHDLYSFMDELKSKPELDGSRKNEALEHLSTIADQGSRPPERREASKVFAAIARVSTIVSAFSSLQESWSKLEPWIKAHFNF